MGEFVTILTIGLVVAYVGWWAARQLMLALWLLMDALDRRWR